MRIDKFTEIVNYKRRHFLFNSLSGAIDEVDREVIEKIMSLSNAGSFTPLESGLKEAFINYMIERGYITCYSDIEEDDEKKWFFEKYKERIKKEKKTASIVLDSIVAKKMVWRQLC